MRDHRKLEIFELADQLVIEIYRATRGFPVDERYGLVSQMRRASVSVVANIVEGCGRRTEAEFDRFLDISFGSLRELGYFIDLSARLEYLKGDELDQVKETQSRVAAAMAAFMKRRDEYR